MDGSNTRIEALSNPEEVSRMSIQTHLATLEKRHRALDQQISGAQTRSSLDEPRLAELKRRKLFMKDEIEHLRQGLRAPAAKVELSGKMKKKAAMRAAKLKLSGWYESATRSISIVKQ